MHCFAMLALAVSLPLVMCHPMVFTVGFAKYPGYDGAIHVNGSVSITESSTEGTQWLTWDLSGLDTTCTEGAADSITNGCGIHVHAGTSCDGASEVLGHFYDADALQEDPWLDVIYVSDGAGRSVGSAPVATGLHASDFAGRAFVVHELADGGRVACSILATAASVSTSSFSAYPGYAGDLVVSGTVSLASAGEQAQVLTWDFAGLDAACNRTGAADDVTNGCGIHVHAGTSCDSHAEVQGHYFGTASDPWLDVVYVSDSSGTSRGTALVQSGVALSGLVGRAFVVHELSSGRRIACGILGESGVARAGHLGSYPGYSGNLTVSGKVTVATSSAFGQQLIVWDLSGLDTACTEGAADNITNGCGVHIHSGTSCVDAGAVGGHLYASQADPWLDVVYVADGSGESKGSAVVETGMDFSALVGRTFVVHQLSSGGRVACGILFPATSLSVPSFSAYPGYAGSLSVSGSVTLDMAASSTQVIAWDLSGLDAACNTSDAADGIANGCGIHVHAGFSCDDKDAVLGHLYSSNLSEDPWKTVTYVADASGSSNGTATVHTGLPLWDMIGRAVVVHRLVDGGRVACGVLEHALEQTTAPPTAAPTPEPTAAPTGGSGGSGSMPTQTPTDAPGAGGGETIGLSSHGSGLAVQASALGLAAFATIAA